MLKSQIEVLYREEKSKMISYVRTHMTEQTRDAEDVVQDVMLQLFSVVDLESRIENLAAYAWQSLKNLVVDSYRKRRIRQQNSLDEKSDQLESRDCLPEDQMLREHFSVHLDQALNALKPSERAIWIATEVEGQTYQDLAEIWEEPIGTLLSRKYRAEKKILNMLNNIYKENEHDEKRI